MWFNVTTAIHELRRTFAEALDPYRPELHYMRGPGPKCRAKRAGAVAKTASVAVAAGTLQQIAEARA